MGENTKAVMKEREISLVDLVIEIFLKWRNIILIMVIGAVLFAGFGYLLSYRNYTKQMQELQKLEKSSDEVVDVKKIEEQLTQSERNNVTNAIVYEEMYAEKLAYQQSSFATNVDPFNVYKADITFWVKSDDMEKTYNIQKIYEDIITCTGMYEYIDEQCAPEYSPSEFISLECTSYSEQTEMDTVRVSIWYNEEEKCKMIANSVVEYVMGQYDLLKESIGEHEISLIENSTGTITKESFLNAQKNVEAELMNLRNNSIAIKAKFSDEEWYYYNYLTIGKVIANPDADKLNEQELEQIVSEMKNVSQPQVDAKYVVLGMIICAFAYVFVVFMLFLLNNKLRSNDSLIELYNLPQLGIVPATVSKKKLFSFIDTWILSLRDRNKRKFNAEEAINMAAVAVKMATKKSSNSEVFFVGCDIKNQTIDVCQKMQSILSKQNIEAKVLDNVLYDAEAMAGLENAHCVVLVEKAGSTLYDEIAKELELLARQDITVLGGIVVE